MAQYTSSKSFSDLASSLLAVGDHRPMGETNTGMKDRVIHLIGLLRSAMFPHVFGRVTGEDMGSASFAVEFALRAAARLLAELLDTVQPEGVPHTERVMEFLSHLPEVKEILESDTQAAYEGDPAAMSTEEIMLAYPAFEAISIYRMAHILYEMKIPMLPRMMTEYAHTITGIDIHPGAKIGRSFFIDHGTGVVIGETCTIGDHVKLYQGVTLGAKSFELDEDGNPVKGIKRHPDIGSHVVIYAGATILGGNTRIGDHCTIGGNVWLTHSVEAGRTVYPAEERGTIV